MIGPKRQTEGALNVQTGSRSFMPASASDNL